MKFIWLAVASLLLIGCSPKSIFMLEKQQDINVQLLREQPATLVINLADRLQSFRVSNPQAAYSLKDAKYSLAIKSGFSDSELGDVRSIWLNDYHPDQANIEQLLKNETRSKLVLHLKRSEIVLEETVNNLGRVSTLMRCNFFFDLFEDDVKAVTFRIYAEDELNLDQHVDDELSECFRIAINKLMRKEML